jgi:hypothetical protein
MSDDNLVENGRTSFHSWIKIALTSFVCALPAWIPLLPMRFLIKVSTAEFGTPANAAGR